MGVPTGPIEEQHSREQHAATRNECCKQQARKNQRKVRKYETYNYETLPRKRGAIRILRLLPSNPQNPEVECELVVQGAEGSPEIAYEALSWCWGTDPTEKYVNIRRKQKVYRKYISGNLFEALKALRYEDRDRYLWVDAVCIDQEDMNEKNHQVEMMYEIYGNAVNVCIWLGVPSETSCLALTFIQEEVLELRDFDELCERRDVSKKWHALLELMQRPWFSRRWVVQEIALAREAVVYCGQHSIGWQEFAIAVELFVEVETATHRLSEIMRKDSKDKHVPGLFEYVSALGASLLVDATDRLFRDYKQEHNVGRVRMEKSHKLKSESDTDSDSEEDSDEDDVIHTPPESDAHNEISNKGNVQSGLTKNNMRPLLSLEYLVSSLTIFETSMPHDTIYALLAIAKDTTPKAAGGRTDITASATHVHEGLDVFTQRKRYNVNYELPYVDVCKEFMEFAIGRSLQIDPSRALDVICRPWATEQKLLDMKRFELEQKEKKRERSELKREGRKRRRIPPSMVQAAQNMSATNPMQDRETGAKNDEEKRERKLQDMKLPSWVPQLSAAPFGMYQQAGLSGPKMSRKNADPLVGLPSTTRKVYSAAETKKVDMKVLKFRKRADKGHFSMYVRGFQVDTIKQVEQVSQNGQIPREWTDLAGWKNTQTKPPPEAFWRTLVADRGKDGKNPPVYYSRACAESFKKGGYESGAVNTSDLINYERNSVVSQFCRRVQAVIWNRALVKTATNPGRLGLVGKDVREGDLVCILYGLSVPVVLRKSKKKSDGELDQEMDWELNYIQKKIRDCFIAYKARKKEHQRRKDREIVPLMRQWLDGLGLQKPRKKAAMNYETVRRALNAFSDWRARRRFDEWTELEKKGLVGDAGDKTQAPKAKDPRSKPGRPIIRKERTSGGAEMSSTPVNRGREKSKLPAVLRSTNPSKERSMAEGSNESNKAPMDWWGFEYALKAGRRWRKLVTVRKQRMEKELQEAVEREWLNRRKEEFALFEKKRKSEGKWKAAEADKPRYLDLSRVKLPVRSKTQSEQKSSQALGTVEDSKEWFKYGSHAPLRRSRNAPDTQQDTGPGAEPRPQEEHHQFVESVGSDPGPSYTDGKIQWQDNKKAPNHLSVDVTKSFFGPMSPVLEEPSDFAGDGSISDLKGIPSGQQTEKDLSTTPGALNTQNEGEGPYTTLSSEDAMQTSVATFLGGPNDSATNISQSPEDTSPAPGEAIPSPNTNHHASRAQLSFSRQPTASDPKASSEAPLPKQSPPSVYRASWHPPDKIYDQISEKDGESVIQQMKEWLKKEIFKEDGYYWYELLGECYIHGIMDGEAMLYQNEGDEAQDGQEKQKHIPSVVYEIR